MAQRQLQIEAPTWAIASTTIYGCLVIALLTPVVAWLLDGDLREARFYYGEWPYWLIVATFLVGQLVLFLVPVQASREPPVPRRSLVAAKVIVLLFTGVLILSAILSICAAAWGDYMGPPGWPESWREGAVLAVFLASWLAWGYAFHRFNRQADAGTVTARGIAWLLKGSIVELLVAIPSHIIVRQKDECCASIFTSLAIGTGIALMLLSFGPGTWLLYTRRMRHLRTGVSARDRPPAG